MALMIPPAFPHDLAKKPKLHGEALVYRALEQGLDDSWSCFYDRGVKGTRRRIDMLALHPARGVLAIEIKGGLVHDRRGGLVQRISRQGARKRVDPFRQLEAGLRAVWAAADLSAGAIPVHCAIWFPEMGQAGLRWQPSPHILTRETLAPGAIAALVDAVLPPVERAVIASRVEVLRTTLEGDATDVSATFG